MCNGIGERVESVIHFSLTLYSKNRNIYEKNVGKICWSHKRRR
jgi:hypothetical protein